MTQLTLNIEDKSLIPALKKLFKTMNGVSIAKPVRKKKTGFEEAMDDLAAGRIHHFDTKEDFYKHFGL